MESKQPASDKPSDLETSKPDESLKGIHVDVAKPDVEVPKPAGPDVLSSRAQSEVRPGPKSTSSKREGISTNPMALVIVGFLLSTIPGGFLTFYYGSRQQELAARRSFSDEVNKIRLQKLGEVWEQLDETEYTINGLLADISFEGLAKDSNSKTKKVHEITRLIANDQAMVGKYRFWLGEDLFHKTTEYLNMSVKYALNKATAPPGTDLTDIMKKREDAKQDILKVRSLFLEGEPTSRSTRAEN